MKKLTHSDLLPKQTSENLIEALRTLPPQVVPLIEHRVYYNAMSRQCTVKSTELLDGESVLVTRDEYDSIDFCPNFRVTLAGKIVPILVDTLHSKLLQLSDTGFATVRDNMIFRVDEGYLGETDHWTLRNYDDE